MPLLDSRRRMKHLVSIDAFARITSVLLIAVLATGAVCTAGDRNPSGLQPSDRETIDRFHRLYYETKPYLNMTFLGVPSMQYPVDNWTIQELIAEVRPEVIVETGTALGGSSLFYATILESLGGPGEVITVDINNFHQATEMFRELWSAETPSRKPPDWPDPSRFPAWQKRVYFIQGDSVSKQVVDRVAGRVKGRRVLVTLDSLHTKEHVAKELAAYAPFVSVGSYLIVQDTHLNGHPNRHWSLEGEGPWEAVEAFLKTHPEFQVDRGPEKHLISQNPSGYLKRIR